MKTNRWPEEDGHRTVEMVHVVSQNINRQTGLTILLSVGLTLAIAVLYPIVAGLLSH